MNWHVLQSRTETIEHAFKTSKGDERWKEGDGLKGGGGWFMRLFLGNRRVLNTRNATFLIKRCGMPLEAARYLTKIRDGADRKPSIWHPRSTTYARPYFSCIWSCSWWYLICPAISFLRFLQSLDFITPRCLGVLNQCLFRTSSTQCRTAFSSLKV